GSLFHRRAEQPDLFFIRRRRRFARRSANDEAFRSLFLDQMVNEPAEGVFVDAIVRVERRHHRGDESSEIHGYQFLPYRCGWTAAAKAGPGSRAGRSAPPL